MGQAVAQRLLAGGHSVVVWNRSPGKADDVVAAGAKEAGAIAEAAEGAEVVITSLSNDDAVEAVALGDGGVHSAIGPDAVYADASTVSPAMSERLESAFPRFVAMPILGAPGAVESGKAIYLAGGDPAVVARLEPVLGGLTDTVRRYDTAAKAGHAKLASNLMLLAEVAALAEAMTVARAGGLTDDQIRELLGNSPMLGPGVKNRFEGVLTGYMETWWTAALGAKDAGLAAGAVRAAGGELPLAELVAGLYRQAPPDEDIIAVADRYRAHSGG
jgi:3-hydroxyisobutyrate dehydrogenase